MLNCHVEPVGIITKSEEETGIVRFPLNDDKAEPRWDCFPVGDNRGSIETENDRPLA